MDRPGRNVHISPCRDDVGGAFDGDLDLTLHHVERLVPRVKVRGWTAALHAFLHMHFKGFAHIAAGKDRDRFANDIDRCRRGLEDVNRAHDDSPQVRLHPPIVGA
ncbi:hypothetical protein D3C80_1433190 [compost metagenome]